MTTASPARKPPLRAARVAFVGRLASMRRPEAHAAVLAAGGLPVSGVSQRTNFVVVGARSLPLRRDGSVSAALAFAEDSQRRGKRIRIIPESEFLELIGRRTPSETASSAAYSLDRVAQIINVAPNVIRRWEHLGLIRSTSGQYDFRDIVSLRSLAALIHEGASLAAIHQSLEGLQRLIPGVERPLAQLKIVAAASGELCAQIEGALLARTGQQVFDFDSADAESAQNRANEAIEIKNLPIPAPEHAESFDSLLNEGLSAEDDADPARAADFYRRAIALEPGRAEAVFNLGNALRAQGLIEAAREMFRLALALDPASELAWYNLADACEEQGDLTAAAEALQSALRMNPDFADALFNLASIRQRQNDHTEAARLFRHYLTLDPDSDWATQARAHLHSPTSPKRERG